MQPGLADLDRNGGMDLIDGRQPRTWKHGFDGAAAVLGDRLDVVLGAMADIEARNGARRNAAAPPEEAVRYAGERLGAYNLDPVTQGCG
jgi:hypothetical protein